MQAADKKGSRENDEEGSANSSEERCSRQQAADQQTSSSSGLDLGPIAMSFGGSAADTQGERMSLSSSVNISSNIINQVARQVQEAGGMLWQSAHAETPPTVQERRQCQYQGCRAYTACGQRSGSSSMKQMAMWISGCKKSSTQGPGLWFVSPLCSA